MVEAGPVVTRPLGMNVKNVPDPQEQAAARLASQGRSHESGVSGIPGGVVVEGTITARQGTHLIGRAADGSPGMPAAAGATCVGGQGVHWTCATPAPTGPERDRRSSTTRSGSEHLAAAEGLLHVYRPSFDGAPQAAAILERIRDEFAPDGITVRPLPVAADPRDGRLAAVERHGRRPRRRAGRRRASRCAPRRSCVRVVREGDRAVGAVLRDQRTGAEEEVRADAVVLAADALRTPQLLWASGIRPEALGRYLTEHPLLFGVVAVRPDVLPPRDERGRPGGPDPGDRRHPVRRGAAPLLRPDDVQPGLARRRCPRAAGSATTRPATSAWAGGSASGRGRRTGSTFEDDPPDENGLPGIRIAYELTDVEEADFERARKHQARAAARPRRVRRRDAARSCRPAAPCTTWAPSAWARPTTAPASATRTRGCGACPAWCSPATA